MCFSTTASLGAGLLLSGVGYLASRKVKVPEQRALASIPVLFAVQQFAEGTVWYSFSDPALASWTHPAALVFLFFAEVLWPAWMPFAILALEKDHWRRRILYSLGGLGLILSAHSIYLLFAYPVDARIVEHHIQYNLGFPNTWFFFLTIAYGVATVAPTFFSSVPKMWVLGLSVLIAFLISRVLYADYIISVWCFFAALISGVVVYILSEMNKKKNTNRLG